MERDNLTPCATLQAGLLELRRARGHVLVAVMEVKSFRHRMASDVERENMDDAIRILTEWLEGADDAIKYLEHGCTNA